MATTEQRTGFRLPWASEARSSATAPDEEAADHDGSGPEGGPTVDTIHDDVEHGQDAAGSGEPDHDPGAVAPRANHEALAPASTAGRGRRDNPLVAGLVRAMREAATATRHESAARFAEEAKARIEAIHVHSADEAARLRKTADADVVEIRDRSKAEMARIRELTDMKIADRRRLLESDVEALSARVEWRIEQVRGAIDAFERQMDAFFERLLAEEDPARLAGLAEQLPEPPELEIDISGPATTAAALDADGAAAAEAEVLGEIEAIDDELDDAAEANIPVVSDLTRRLDALSGPAAPMPEPRTTRVAVSGLASVASIAGFKRALAKSTGVRSVSVASGPTGDFIFTVAHEPETDLRSGVPLLDGFSAVITGDADDVITVMATDPERAK